MRMNFAILMFGIVVLISSCSDTQNKQLKDPFIYSNNFESYVGWTGNSYPNVRKCNAASGKYACLISKEFPYSLGFEIKIADIGKVIDKVIVSNSYFNDNLKEPCKMVCEIRNDADSVIFWQGEIMNKDDERLQWKNFECTFKIPQNLPENSKIRFYAFHYGDGRFLIDDFTIHF